MQLSNGTFNDSMVSRYIIVSAKLLLPALRAVAENNKGHKARVVSTTSFATEFVFKADYEAYRDGPTRRKAGVVTLYYQSKFLNLVYATEFARRFENEGIVSSCVNPGGISYPPAPRNLTTDLQRTLKGFKRWLIFRILHPAPYSALTQLYAATSEDADDHNGAYFVPWARKQKLPPASQDPEIGKELWNWLEDQVKK
ncbi:hypothetical protein D9758_017118 [Tetrapyrgos nigripes]|uniref:NAD(P)-binding protein n=1 Tax=Tetrapyrgos nigripes TaxID=182062 RepID=A0A8H5CK36_9AGAR|nr:hypothetical protein D9758_017118 [Tetrapyrgos nigripes]